MPVSCSRQKPKPELDRHKSQHQAAGRQSLILTIRCLRLTRLTRLGLLLLGAFVLTAEGDFVSPYGLSDFTLTNSGFADGYAATPDNGHSVVLTGPNDGSGFPGYTQLTVISHGDGPFQFTWVYSSLDVPNADSAGYLLNGHLYTLATADGQSGTVSIPVHHGDVIGFRIDSVDNIGEPGVLTISTSPLPHRPKFRQRRLWPSSYWRWRSQAQG